MLDAIERLFEAYDQKRIGRREAVVALAGLVAVLSGAGRGLRAAEQGTSSTFEATALNHIALRVTDVARSRDFYRKHLGLQVLRDSGSSCFLSCGPENFVALFRGSRPGLDHYCYTIEDYDPRRVVQTLEQAGLDPSRQENRVYFPDPDGLTVQLSGKRDAWPG